MVSLNMTQPIILEPALAWSGVLQRKVDAHPAFGQWLAGAIQHPLDRQRLLTWFVELGGRPEQALTPAEARQILRRLRERVFFTLMARDIAGAAPLQEVVSGMTQLADLAITQAYRSVATELAAVHGTPLDPETGAPQEMLILGMGKLGGCELNVSSDIDLIMLYGEDGETQGRRPLSNHEFYGRLTRQMMRILSEVDANGYVFRTDLRLRPDGDGSPLAWSLDALEHYLVAQGREWERYAWLKARCILVQAFPGSDLPEQINQLEALRKPFVFRKYFDFDAFAALRTLRKRIREDWNR